MHRLLRRKPGELPEWLLTSSGCSGDAASVVSGCLCAVSIAATYLAVGGKVRFNGFAGFWMGLVLFVFWVAIWVTFEMVTFEPCRAAERKARAIARRRKAADEHVNLSAANSGDLSESN